MNKSATNTTSETKSIKTIDNDGSIADDKSEAQKCEVEPTPKEDKPTPTPGDPAANNMWQRS